MARIDAFLKLGLAQGCSDVHLAVGVPPMLRMNGDLMPIKFRQLSDTELETYVLEVLYSGIFPVTYPSSMSCTSRPS
jgi:twitching motility protein PilT